MFKIVCKTPLFTKKVALQAKLAVLWNFLCNFPKQFAPFKYYFSNERPF